MNADALAVDVAAVADAEHNNTIHVYIECHSPISDTEPPRPQLRMGEWFSENEWVIRSDEPPKLSKYAMTYLRIECVEVAPRTRRQHHVHTALLDSKPTLDLCERVRLSTCGFTARTPDGREVPRTRQRLEILNEILVGTPRDREGTGVTIVCHTREETMTGWRTPECATTGCDSFTAECGGHTR